MNKEVIADRFRSLQAFITERLEKIDGTSLFQEDLWSREAGGGGRTRTIKEVISQAIWNEHLRDGFLLSCTKFRLTLSKWLRLVV
jgi:hypothetical protein